MKRILTGDNTTGNLHLGHFVGSIKKFETFNGKYVWSPAKIIQICTELLEEEDFENSFVSYLQKNYTKEAKLLNFDD